VSWYQKSKTNLDFTEARDSEWQWHQLRHMQVCTSLQTDNHASTQPLNFLQAGCPSCCPTNSVKALKAKLGQTQQSEIHAACHIIYSWPLCVNIMPSIKTFYSEVSVHSELAQTHGHTTTATTTSI